MINVCGWLVGRASAVHSYLGPSVQDLDKNSVKEMFLFSDGCRGQNKNFAIASMLLHVVIMPTANSYIFLKFVYCITRSWRYFLPVQLIPLIRLVRQRSPRHIQSTTLNHKISRKSVAEVQRVLSVRKYININMDITYTIHNMEA
ncbi:hypothetical protein J6590_024904 [Homalodisca vitripennis]|nr:hypothetical protein J6590_024904 [Homalodisca vitripennis]